MTAYIVQVSLGDTPQGTLEYRTIFAVGMLLFIGTFGLNLVSAWLRERFREDARERRPDPIVARIASDPCQARLPGAGDSSAC